MARGLIALIFLLTFNSLYGQKTAATLISGPMPGHITSHSARVWILAQNAENLTISLINDSGTLSRNIDTTSQFTFNGYCAWIADFEQLQEGTEYRIIAILDGDTVSSKTSLKTWDQNSDQDFSFMLGSCAFMPPRFMKPFYPGHEEWIYYAMMKVPSDFMIWLGDNLYYDESECDDPLAMLEHQVKQRKIDKLNRFVKSRPQYSIWDDHDFGPNNSYGDYALKDTALFINNLFWPNPIRKDGTAKGNYYSFSRNNIDFIMLDNRFHASPESDTPRTALGEEQLQWLFEKLRKSTADFIFISSGSQFLNEVNVNECYMRFPEERARIIRYIEENQIKNIIFLTGDRHHTEMMKKELAGGLILYDFTCSPLTSVVRPTKVTAEMKNEMRIPGSLITRHNFGRIKVRGKTPRKNLEFEVFNVDNELIWEYTVKQEDPR